MARKPFMKSINRLRAWWLPQKLPFDFYWWKSQLSGWPQKIHYKWSKCKKSISMKIYLCRARKIIARWNILLTVKTPKTSYSETQTFIDFYFYHFSSLFTFSIRLFIQVALLKPFFGGHWKQLSFNKKSMLYWQNKLANYFQNKLI